jgi:GNAT superfamily N-acetyltransferase
MSDIHIRPAGEDDIPVILDLIRALAEYEKARPEEVAVNQAVLRESLFGARPAAEVLLAEADGATAGFALFFHNFSTWQGRRGLYLEDLFVRPAMRGRGLAVRLGGHGEQGAHDRLVGLALGAQYRAVDLEFAHPRYLRDPQHLGDFRAYLTGLSIERILAEQDQVEALALEPKRQGACGCQRIGAGKGAIFKMDRAIDPCRKRFDQCGARLREAADSPPPARG